MLAQGCHRVYGSGSIGNELLAMAVKPSIRTNDI